MVVGNQNQVGFNNVSELFANVLKLIGPNAQIIGPNFIFNNKGLFLYSGTPALGNLVASITAAAGPNDGLGNPFSAGFTSYTATAFTQIFGGNVLIGDTGKPGVASTLFSNNSGHNGFLSIDSGKNALTDTSVTIELYSNPTAGNVAAVFAQNNAGRITVGPIIEAQGAIAAVLAAAAVNAFQILVSGDTNPRFQIDSNGKMQWGTGAAAPDTDLFRDPGGGRLNTDSNFFATGAILTFADFIGLQNPSTNNFIEASILNAANATFAVDYAGKHYWGPGGATATDTDLFRQAVNTLATDSIWSLKNAASAPPAISGYTEIVGSGANLPFVTGASGQGWFLSGATQADFTGTVVVGTGNNLFGKQWTIDANDANAGDGYEFDFQIFGKQGTTQQGLTIGWNFNATNIGSIAFPSTFAGIGAVFLIRGKLVIDIVSGGASGGFYWHLLASSSAAGGIQATQGGGPTSATQNGINATVNNTVQFYAGWGSTTGAPTMTSLVERMRKVA